MRQLASLTLKPIKIHSAHPSKISRVWVFILDSSKLFSLGVRKDAPNVIIHIFQTLFLCASNLSCHDLYGNFQKGKSVELLGAKIRDESRELLFWRRTKDLFDQEHLSVLIMSTLNNIKTLHENIKSPSILS